MYRIRVYLITKLVWSNSCFDEVFEAPRDKSKIGHLRRLNEVEGEKSVRFAPCSGNNSIVLIIVYV